MARNVAVRRQCSHERQDWNAGSEKQSSGSWHRKAQTVDCTQDGLEQPPGHCHLRELESDPPGVANNLCPDLDQFLPSCRQGPAPNFPRQDQLPEEVSKVVGQHEEMQPHLVVYEIMAREARPLYRMLAFLDPLFCRSPLVTESDNAFGRTSEVRNDEANPGKQFAFVPFNLGDHITLQNRAKSGRLGAGFPSGFKCLDMTSTATSCGWQISIHPLAPLLIVREAGPVAPETDAGRHSLLPVNYTEFNKERRGAPTSPARRSAAHPATVWSGPHSKSFDPEPTSVA